jgi:hypothetical protein
VPPAPASDGSDESPATIAPVSWFHPNGRRYVPSLFTTDGTNTLLGLSHDILADGWTGRYQWLTCDLTALRCLVAFGLSRDPEAFSRDLLYGSATRDVAGRHYVVGMAGYQPIVLHVEPRKRTKD